ncbi:MAG: peptidase T [Bacillota bacterium]|nr:peptidase T [Bacillota bacterium]
MKNVVERFIEYVKVDTKSDENSESCPSTKNQYEFGRKLVEELIEIGLQDVSIDSNGYVMGTIPSNAGKSVPVLSFIAHMDTSPDMSGSNVQPNIVRNYDGGDIVLNRSQNIILSPSAFPELKSYKDQDLIVTDGTTLLGADDKAGIAEIITACEILVNKPELKHGTIKVTFTPDEEIGRGADRFNVEKFGADFAYTVDGGEIGQLEYENFNAAAADIEIHGQNVHPGSAKNKMLNSILIAMEFNSMLPPAEIPANTEGYEGFYHLNNMEGSVEATQLHYLIRDHDKYRFEARKQVFEKIVRYINDKYGKNIITLKLKDQYYNMKEKIEPVFHIVETAKKAMEAVGVTPLITPVRGGTDGAKLSYMGLPTPNLFTGGLNYHGKFEFIPVNSMNKAVEVILKITELYAEE